VGQYTVAVSAIKWLAVSSGFTSEYDTWIDILHYVAGLCNGSVHRCPHPEEYIAACLRD